MTAWSEAEKSNLRAYLGFPSLFHQIEPRLENAITAVQAVADGGALPTDDTQTRMRGVLTQLANIDSLLGETQTYAEALTVDADGSKSGGVRVDYVRKGFYLRSEGRRLIAQLGIPLGTKPFRDYYSGLPLNDDPFSPFPTDLG